jgi:hypothetical protein
MSSVQATVQVMSRKIGILTSGGSPKPLAFFRGTCGLAALGVPHP